MRRGRYEDDGMGGAMFVPHFDDEDTAMSLQIDSAPMSIEDEILLSLPPRYHDKLSPEARQILRQYHDALGKLKSSPDCVKDQS